MRLLLPGILIVACTVRFWGLSDRGLYYYDEGRNYLEAKAALALLTGRTGVAESIQIRDARPAHNFTTAALLAVHDSPNAVLYLSAAWGVVTVWLVALLAARIWGPREALIAAAALAVSPYHAAYSRSGLVDSALAALAAAALLALLRGREAAGRGRAAAWVFAAGLAVGFALGHSVRAIPVAVCAVIAAGVLGLFRPPLLAALALGALLPPAVCDLLQRHWASGLGTAAPGVFPSGPYAAQAWSITTGTAGFGFAPSALAALPGYFLPVEGPVAVTWALAAAAVWLVRRHSRVESALHLFWWAPFAFYGLYSGTAHRFFLAAFPFLALARARVLGLGLDRLARGRDRAVVAGLLIAASLPWLARLRADSSPYLELLRRTGTPDLPHLTTNLPVGRALAGVTRCEVVPGNAEEAETLRRAGFRYLIVDLQPRFGGEAATEGRRRMVAAIERGRVPVLSVPWPPVTLELYVLNQHAAGARQRDALAGLGLSFPAVRLYDLGKAKWAMPPAASATKENTERKRPREKTGGA